MFNTIEMVFMEKCESTRSQFERNPKNEGNFFSALAMRPTSAQHPKKTASYTYCRANGDRRIYRGIGCWAQILNYSSSSRAHSLFIEAAAKTLAQKSHINSNEEIKMCRAFIHLCHYVVSRAFHDENSMCICICLMSCSRAVSHRRTIVSKMHTMLWNF